jgi:hypothetical protein
MIGCSGPKILDTFPYNFRSLPYGVDLFDLSAVSIKDKLLPTGFIREIHHTHATALLSFMVGNSIVAQIPSVGGSS